MDTEFRVLEYTNGNTSGEPDFTYDVSSLDEAARKIEHESNYNRNYEYRNRTKFRVERRVTKFEDVPFRLGGVVFDV